MAVSTTPLSTLFAQSERNCWQPHSGPNLPQGKSQGHLVHPLGGGAAPPPRRCPSPGLPWPAEASGDRLRRQSPAEVAAKAVALLAMFVQQLLLKQGQPPVAPHGAWRLSICHLFKEGRTSPLGD